jgi:hypothetical protein
MKRWLAAAVVVLGLLAYHGQAQAACSVHTYFINGQLISCTTCCTGTYCNTTCI